MTARGRSALFISHANPDDNAFVRWIGAKLAALGYEVWADVLRLRGGHDWQRELEDALRNRAVKLLLVATQNGLDKQGVRNEIQIATDVAKKLGDTHFIIPLRLTDYEAPFLVAHTQYIDFNPSWASGFAELLETLESVYKVPRLKAKDAGPWIEALSVGSTKIVARPEYLTSNWLQFRAIPGAIHYVEPPSGFPLERFHDRSLHRWAVAPVQGGGLTFALPDGQGFLAPEVPARNVTTFRLDKFLSDGCPALGLSNFDARNVFSDLGNQAFESFLHGRGLTAYGMSGGRRAWWGNIKTVPKAKVRFNWPHNKGLRQLIGQSGKRGVHWHFAINAQVRTAPIRHLRVSSRLIFSGNGLDALNDPKKMHRLRRSFAKSWRNARWRDMLLAFLWWLSDGSSEIVLPIAHGQYLRLAVPPRTFKTPFSVAHSGTDVPDEDDPDIEYDEAFDDDAFDESGIDAPEPPA